jgi:hypothetical protein
VTIQDVLKPRMKCVVLKSSSIRAPLVENFGGRTAIHVASTQGASSINGCARPSTVATDMTFVPGASIRSAQEQILSVLPAPRSVSHHENSAGASRERRRSRSRLSTMERGNRSRAPFLVERCWLRALARAIQEPPVIGFRRNAAVPAPRPHDRGRDMANVGRLACQRRNGVHLGSTGRSGDSHRVATGPQERSRNIRRQPLARLQQVCSTML